MSGLNDSKRRDFITQLIVVLEQNAQLLTAKGFDPANKIAQLKEDLNAVEQAEGRQHEAMAAAKDATKLANDKLIIAYTEGSATVDLITGLLGKKDNLVIEIKKMRKVAKPKPKKEVQA